MFDLQVWEFQPPDNIAVATANADTKVAGIQKLAQRFLIALLTEYGSVRYCRAHRQKRGTLFMSQLHAGEYRSEADLMAAFGVAAIMIKSQLRDEEHSDDPDDERLKNVRLEQVILTPAAINLIILIQSMADEMRFVLPLEAN